MAHDHDQLTELVAGLRELMLAPSTDRAVFGRIAEVTKFIEQNSPTPLIAASAVDVRFKAEDVYAREHLMPEAILREMLNDRVNRLDAAVRAATPVMPLARPSRRPAEVLPPAHRASGPDPRP